MIKISKMNDVTNEMEEFEYNSINKACQLNGATNGYNRKNALNYLEKCGFDISTLVEEEKTKRVKTSIVKQLEKLCKTIDKEEIKKLLNERLEIVANMKKTSDMEKIVKLNEKIEKLQNPKVTLQDLQDKLNELYAIEYE